MRAMQLTLLIVFALSGLAPVAADEIDDSRRRRLDIERRMRSLQIQLREWDRKAAEMGDPIAKLNYGLDLLRGYGVKQNPDLARRYIDEAADAGVKDAIAVQPSGYDYNVVTPDADNWKYEKRLF